MGEGASKKLGKLANVYYGWSLRRIFSQKNMLAKGQLISKCLFGIFNSLNKQTKKLDFTTMVPQVELFSFVFWEN